VTMTVTVMYPLKILNGMSFLNSINQIKGLDFLLQYLCTFFRMVSTVNMINIEIFIWQNLDDFHNHENALIKKKKTKQTKKQKNKQTKEAGLLVVTL
jgi:hypothetical protein